MGCLKKSCFGCSLIVFVWIVAIVAVVANYIFVQRKYVQYVEPLNLYFQTINTDSTTILAFDTLTSPFRNMIEVSKASDIGGIDVMFLVNNSTGNPKIEYIIIRPEIFFDFQIRGYNYSVETIPPIYYEDNHDIVDTLRDIVNFPIVEKLLDVKNTSYYLVSLNFQEYGRGVVYSIRDLGSRSNFENFLKYAESPTNNYVKFVDLAKRGYSYDYVENTKRYGNPKSEENHIVTKKNKNEYIKKGWLFLNNQILENNLEVKVVKWEVNNADLIIIYKVSGERIEEPLNGIFKKDIYLLDEKNNFINKLSNFDYYQ